jgi:hypothetical protein
MDQVKTAICEDATLACGLPALDFMGKCIAIAYFLIRCAGVKHNWVQYNMLSKCLIRWIYDACLLHLNNLSGSLSNIDMMTYKE